MTTTACGPSGGPGGNPFSDLLDVPRSAPLAAVEVREGTLIDAARVVYRQRSGESPTGWHGGSGGELRRLALRPDEHVTALRGTYGFAVGYGQVVSSLVVQTNQRQRALRAGAASDAEFLYEAPDGYEVAGLTGAAGSLLDAVGVIFRSRPADGTGGLARCGPTGGVGGSRFSDASLLLRTPGLAPSVVTVSGDRFVDSIAVRYRTAAGDVVRGRRHGGSGGQSQDLVLERGEYITAISGRFGTLVDTLAIDTNRREGALLAGGHFRPLEPRTLPTGTYRYEAPRGTEIVGFFGRAGDFVDALGVILRRRGA